MIKNITTFIIFITLVLISGTVYSQTTGSIGGTITDAKNAPLGSATVKIVGTNMGAITDDNGEFVILNVDVGTYTLEASFIGFDTKRISNVKVSVDQRTKINIQLSEVGVTTDIIEITAERKGIEVDQSGRLVTQETIENAGLRGITNIVSKTAGVISDERGTSINIRGGRSSENLIIVDGVATTNPLDGSSTAFVPNSLMEEVSVLTGGFGAEYGNALSGVINVSTKRGTDKYSGSAEVISDVVAGDWIKTVSQGYNLYNLTLGGPLVPVKGLDKVINFFGTVERQYQSSYQSSWIGEKVFNRDMILKSAYADSLSAEQIDYLSQKRLPNNGQGVWSYNGRLNFNFNETKAQIPIQLRFGYSRTETNSRPFSSAYWLRNWQNMRRYEQLDEQIYGRLSHNISSKFFYELQFNKYSTLSELGDNNLWDNLFAYGDTTLNPILLKYHRIQGQSLPSDPTSGGMFSYPGTFFTGYQKTDVSYLGGKLDATWAINTKKYGDHEVKFGGEYRYHTLRKLLANFVPELAMRDNPLSVAFYGRNNAGRMYGYDLVDPLTNTSMDPEASDPKHPIVGALYLRDKIDFGDFTVNAGVRMDYLDVNTLVLKSPDVVYNDAGVLLADELWKQNDKEILFSPRLGFSFPITEKTVFIAQFGKFVQMPALNYLYISKMALKAALSNSVQDIYENPTLKPEKLTSYEIGIKHQVGDIMDIGITAYYRETKDQIGITRIKGQILNGNPTSGYGTYFNTDFSISRGIDFQLSLRRTNRIAVDLAYTLLYASGIGSNPDSKNYLGNNSDPTDPEAGFPRFVFPLDFDQRHTGSINVDYRFGSTDVPKGFLGEVLKNFGVNLLFTFNSGRPFTAREFGTAWNADDGRILSTKNQLYTDWNLRFDLKVDKSFNIFKTNWNIYAYVQNLLNSELVNNVFGSTGLPGENGWLSSPTGSQSTPEFKQNFYQRMQAAFLGNWGIPRTLRVGVRVSL